jgi:hypothetical protein
MLSYRQLGQSLRKLEKTGLGFLSRDKSLDIYICRGKTGLEVVMLFESMSPSSLGSLL